MTDREGNGGHLLPSLAESSDHEEDEEEDEEEDDEGPDAASIADEDSFRDRCPGS